MSSNDLRLSIGKGDYLFDPLKFSSAELSDFTLGRITLFDDEWEVIVERVISIHLLHMRSNSALQDWRTLDELTSQLQVSVGPTRITGTKPESQTVVLASVTARPHPTLFVTHPRSAVGGPAGSEIQLAHEDPRLQLFMDDIAGHLSDIPEEHWRQTAIQALAFGAEPKSPWAEALGPLYSVDGIASALNLPREQLLDLARSGVVISLVSAEGDLLFPIAQVRRDAKLVRGLQWILAQLNEDMIDRYTLAAWLASPKRSLNGHTVWEALQDSDSITSQVRDLVLEYRSGLAQ